MARHEYDRNVNICFDQLRLKIEAAQPWQPDVKHQTTFHVRKGAAQQFGGGTEHLYLESNGAKQASECLAQGLIIFNDENDRLCGRRRRWSWTMCH